MSRARDARCSFSSKVDRPSCSLRHGLACMNAAIHHDPAATQLAGPIPAILQTTVLLLIAAIVPQTRLYCCRDESSQSQSQQLVVQQQADFTDLMIANDAIGKRRRLRPWTEHGRVEKKKCIVPVCSVQRRFRRLQGFAA